MEKEFLESLGLTPEAVEAVLEKQQEAAAAHEKELARVRFDAALENAVHQAGGRNHTAICALLDVEALAEKPEEIDNAVEALKKECGYLFETPIPPVYAAGTGTCRGEVTQQPVSLAEALREKFKRK